MNPYAASERIEQTISSAVETMIDKRPVLAPLLRPFAEIVSAKARIARELKADVAVKDLGVEPSRLLDGAPLLDGISFDSLQEELDRSFSAMLPALRRAFGPIAEDLSRLEIIHGEGALNLSRLSRAYLDGDASVLRSSAQTTRIPEEVLVLAIGMILAPVLMTVAASLGTHARRIAWVAGYCPICGSMPSISYLAEAGDLGSEFLQGGGGQRYLHCSMCGHEWRIKRNMCPACESEDKDLQVYFQMEGERSERVDVCRNCGTYLPCLDLRETGGKPSMDIAAVAMVHLDYWASEKGFHPLVQTPWNLVQ